VFFTARGGASQLFMVVSSVAESLQRDCRAIVSLEWCFGSDTPAGRLRCPPADVPSVATWLSPNARRSGS
jgi:hypothetical protein